MTLTNININTIPTNRTILIDNDNNQAPPETATKVAVLRYIPASVPTVVPAEITENLNPVKKLIPHTIQLNLTGVTFVNLYAKKAEADPYFMIADRLPAGAELSFGLLPSDFQYGDLIIVKAEDADNAGIFDEISGTIAYILEITSPLESADLYKGEVFNVEGTSNLASLFVYLWDGTTWVDIGSGAQAVVDGAFSISCEIPVGHGTGARNIRVVAENNTQVYEERQINVTDH